MIDYNPAHLCHLDSVLALVDGANCCTAMMDYNTAITLLTETGAKSWTWDIDCATPLDCAA